MFGIGTQEILIILVLAIIIIGPKRLPEVATTVGKGLAEFKKAFDGLKDGMTADFRTELEKEDILKKYPHLAESEAAQAAAAKVEESPAAPPPSPESPAAPIAPDPYATAGEQPAPAPAEDAPPAADGPPDLSKLEPNYKPEEMES